jgi:hypothetical protein
MLQSLQIQFVVLGHSERREYFAESNQLLAEKLNICLENKIQPIFCCGEPLQIREAATQNEFVAQQLKNHCIIYRRSSYSRSLLPMNRSGRSEPAKPPAVHRRRRCMPISASSSPPNTGLRWLIQFPFCMAAV